MIVKVIYIVGLLLLSMTASANVIYKTIKEDGTVVYSDVPSEGATPMNLSSVNSAVIPTLGGTPNNAKANSIAKKRTKSEVSYAVYIRSPEAEASLRDNSGNVSVSVQVIPKKAGKFQLILDGEIVGTQGSNIFKLENVDRGAHIIEVYFLDNSGKILASSKKQTFYLHKASALITVN